MAPDKGMAPAGEAATNYSPPSYEISAADAPHAQAVLGLDPFRDIASSCEIGEGVRFSALPSLDGLSPAMRAEVVEAIRRGESEPEAIAKTLETNGRNVRALIGNGANSTPYHDELIDIAREVRSASQEFDRITAQMTEIVRHDTGPTGEAIPVYAMSGAAQRHAAARLAELNYKIGLLVTPEGGHGVEAQRRLDRALFDAVEARKAHTAQIEEHEEAQARAKQILREERINAKAEMFAKHKRVTL